MSRYQCSTKRLNLGGDEFDEREDGSDVGGTRSQLQALIQEVSSAGMSPQVQLAPDEHEVPAGRTDDKLEAIMAKLVAN